MSGNPQIAAAAKKFLLDVSLFARYVLKMPLRGYQLEPIKAIVESVLFRKGLEFVWIFPRQSGKNETAAILLVFISNLLQRKFFTAVFASPTGRQMLVGFERLKQRFTNDWNKKEFRPNKSRDETHIALNNFRTYFLSSHPKSGARGATATHLLVHDEFQDWLEIQANNVFAPMAAAHNATRLYMGTSKSDNTALARKVKQLRLLEAQDGVKRVFIYNWRDVEKENPPYGVFVRGEIKKWGEKHPYILAEYECQEIPSTGGLFNVVRISLMLGSHQAEQTPRPGILYGATLDVAGEDESLETEGYLANSKRDYTVCWIWEIDTTTITELGGPRFKAVACFADRGGRKFGTAGLNQRLYAFLKHWNAKILVGDNTGVGEGLVKSMVGRIDTVIPFVFTKASKSQLGFNFLAMVDTGRVHIYDTADEHQQAFFRQAGACGYEILPHGELRNSLRWGVPDGATYEAESGERLPIHDDYLLSAALLPELNEVILQNPQLWEYAQSVILPPPAGLWGSDEPQEW